MSAKQNITKQVQSLNSSSRSHREPIPCNFEFRCMTETREGGSFMISLRLGSSSSSSSCYVSLRLHYNTLPFGYSIPFVVYALESNRQDRHTITNPFFIPCLVFNGKAMSLLLSFKYSSSQFCCLRSS